MLPARVAAAWCSSRRASSSRWSQAAPQRPRRRARSSARPTPGARASSSSATSTRRPAATKPVSGSGSRRSPPEAIRDGLRRAARRPRLRRAGRRRPRARSRADWLVGMNLSRAYSARATTTTSRSAACRRRRSPCSSSASWRSAPSSRRTTSRSSPRSRRADAERAGIEAPTAARASRRGTRARRARRLPAGRRGGRGASSSARRRGRARIESVERETRRMPPPLLYDLTELQRHANRLFGFSAQQTLELAQALYERHKLLSYPRTDSRHLSHATWRRRCRAVVRAIAAPYAALARRRARASARSAGASSTTRKVTDHHAIIPTAAPRRRALDLPADERKLYDLVCRRLLAAWHDDHVCARDHGDHAHRDRRRRRAVATASTAPARRCEQEGWKVLDVGAERQPAPAKGARPRRRAPGSPPGLAPGQPQRVVDVEAVRQEDRGRRRASPTRTLLTAMETAGRDARREGALARR